MNNYYLAHHGILGQKWGIRRFQEPDGDYTSAGRRRYGLGDGKSYNGVNSKESSSTSKKSSKIRESFSKVYNKAADKGQELHERGATKKSIATKAAIRTTATAVTGWAASTALRKAGIAVCTKYGPVPVSSIGSFVIEKGSKIVNGVLLARDAVREAELIAYDRRAKQR